jgi:hypothetical protein
MKAKRKSGTGLHFFRMHVPAFCGVSVRRVFRPMKRRENNMDITIQKSGVS